MGANNQGIIELGQHLALAGDTVIVLGVHSDLHDILTVVFCHQKRHSGRTRAKLSEDLIATRQYIVGFGLGGITHELIGGCCQFVFDLIQMLQEVLNGLHANANVGISAILNQFIERLRSTIDHSTHPKTTLISELLSQGHEVLSRRLTRKKVIAYGTEREYILMFTKTVSINHGLWRHEQTSGIVRELLNMDRRSDLMGDKRLAADSLTIPQLPVGDDSPWGPALGVQNKDRPGAQCAMYDVLSVCEADSFTNLADEVQTLVISQSVFLLNDVVIQPDRVWMMLKYDGRAKLVIGELHGPQYTPMLKSLQQPELTLSRSPDDLLLCGFFALNQIDSDTTKGLFQTNVATEEVLISRALVQQIFQLIITDLTASP